jgi:membrane protein implicated in regulation of membrane protease activity
MSGRGGRVLAGFVVLHLLCCGLPLLIAAGAFTGAGAAALGSTTLVAMGVAAAVVAVLFAVRRARSGRGSVDGDCCDVRPDDERVATGERR